MQSPATKAPVFRPRDDFGKSLFRSFAAHLLLILAFFGIGRISPLKIFEAPEELRIPIQDLSENTEENKTMMEDSGPQPFSGRGLEIPHVATPEERSAVEVKKIQSLSEQMAKLKNLSLSSGLKENKSKSVVDMKHLDESLSKVRKSIIGVRGGLSGAARGAKLQMSASNSVSKTIGPEDEAKVREIFESLQGKFSAAYDAALKVDPNLSLVLTYEATVGANGNLTKLKFKAQGDYSPKGLEALESQMSAVLTKVYLGKNLSAVIIKGERLFVQ